MGVKSTMKISQEIDQLYFPRDFATMVDMRYKMDESEYYSKVYKELNELVGKEATEKIWAAYHGRIVSSQRICIRMNIHASMSEGTPACYNPVIWQDI